MQPGETGCMCRILPETDVYKRQIFGMPQVPDGLYLDTEQNREIIQKYLAHKTPTTGRSDSIDEAAGRRCTIKSKEELLIEEANALDSLFMSMKIEDISIEIRDNQLVAFDSDGNKWVENEIFDFALNECLTFGADGHLIDEMCIRDRSGSVLRHPAMLPYTLRYFHIQRCRSILPLLPVLPQDQTRHPGFCIFSRQYTSAHRRPPDPKYRDRCV